MLNPRVFILPGLLGVMIAGASCSDYRETGTSESASEHRVRRAEETVKAFLDRDPTMSRFFEQSHGYAVLPKVTKGAAGIGAAHGDGGVVYEKGRVIGSAEMTQITVGIQLGGQDYAEIIFFESAANLEEFKRNNTEFAANASAVGATSGASSTADYSEGIAVFTMPIGGLMFEAAIGGQKFRFYPDSPG